MARTKAQGTAIRDGGRLNDTLINVLAGIGGTRDKGANTTHYFNQLDAVTLANFYASNWMAQKVVDFPVDDSMRRPREISCESLQEKVQVFRDAEESKLFRIHRKIKKAVRWSRLFGGAGIIVAVDGQGDNTQPLDPFKIRAGQLKAVNVVPRSKLNVSELDLDITSPTYGEPKMFSVNGVSVHASRVHIIKGVEMPEDLDVAEPYWGISVLQATEDAINQTSTVLYQLAHMVFEANVDVVKVKGLAQKLATRSGEDQVINRFRVGNMMKSVQQMMLIDKDLEEYERAAINLGSFPSLPPLYLSAVAGASGIPATRFLGKSPDGMNATGESDESIYLDFLESLRNEKINDAYDFIDPILCGHLFGSVPDDWNYDWPDFHQTPEKERSEVEKMDAETDETLMSLGIVNEYHIADRLLKSGRYPAMTEEDVQEIKDFADKMPAAMDDPETPDTEDEPQTPEPENIEAPQPDLKEAAEGGDIQKQALNGAQVSSLVEISKAVANRELALEAAVSIILTAIPGLDNDTAIKIAGVPKAEQPAPPPVSTMPFNQSPPKGVEDDSEDDQ